MLSEDYTLGQLIDALKLLQQYEDTTFPTSCEHDVLYVHVDPGSVSIEDLDALKAMGFYANDQVGSFQSTRFGSA